MSDTTPDTLPDGSRYARVVALSLDSLARDMRARPVLPGPDVEIIRAAVRRVQDSAAALQANGTPAPDAQEFSDRVEMTFWQMELVHMCQRLKTPGFHRSELEMQGVSRLVQHLQEILDGRRIPAPAPAGSADE